MKRIKGKKPRREWKKNFVLNWDETSLVTGLQEMLKNQISWNHLGAYSELFLRRLARLSRPLESGEEWKYMKFILIIAHLSLSVPFVALSSFLLRTYACLPPSLGSCNMLSKAQTTTYNTTHIILLATLRSERWLNMGNCWALEGGLSASKHETMKYARIVMCLTRLSDKVMCCVLARPSIKINKLLHTFGVGRSHDSWACSISAYTHLRSCTAHSIHFALC